MGSVYSNYPDGIDGSHPYFNPPNEPECSDCGYTLESDWRYCPNCGERTEYDRDREAELGDYLYDMYVDRKVMGE